MELTTYKAQTKPLAVTLKGEDVVNVVYLVNYFTLPLIEALNEMVTADATSVAYNIKTLSEALQSIDITLNGDAVPFANEKEKTAALANLSATDIFTLLRAIQNDINGETKNDSTDSADG